jgi:hypothetical protein
MAVLPFHADNPRPQNQSQGKRREHQPFSKWAFEEYRPHRRDTLFLNPLHDAGVKPCGGLYFFGNTQAAKEFRMVTHVLQFSRAFRARFKMARGLGSLLRLLTQQIL